MQLISSLNLKNSEYLSKYRLISFHHQFRLIFELGDEVKNILEIGIFNSIFADVLRRNGYNITTADIDPNLHPDLILDLTSDFSLPQNKFDAIVLFQVLEHFPYEQSEQALKKLAAITKKYLVISLPYKNKYFNFRLHSSFTGRPRYFNIRIPQFWNNKVHCNEHFWEVGLKDYPQKRILNSIAKAGLKVKYEFIDVDYQYHYFLVLEKNI